MEKEIKIGDIITFEDNRYPSERAVKNCIVIGIKPCYAFNLEDETAFRYRYEALYTEDFSNPVFDPIYSVLSRDIMKSKKGHWPKEILQVGNWFKISLEGKTRHYMVRWVNVASPNVVKFCSNNIYDYVINSNEVEYVYYDENDVRKTIKHKDIFKPTPLSVNETKALSLI